MEEEVREAEAMDVEALPDHVLFAWGSTREAQLGFGASEDDTVLQPKSVVSLQNEEIASVACGQSHSLFLTTKGKMLSCGSNDYGQKGQNRSNSKPEQVNIMEDLVIKGVAAGNKHSMAVTDTGQVFCWGSNSEGQLGRENMEDNYSAAPKLVPTLSSFPVVQVACGLHHNVVLTDDGRIFTWGGNQHGQCGIGDRTSKVTTPQQVTSLQGLPVSQIAAGGNHSFILSVSGALFGWGKNEFGQLGLGDQKDRCWPSLCKTLKTQKVQYVACGEDHTAVLTNEGGVFTFGAGSYGQLGHNSIQPEFLPKKVFELMGSMVSQIACGRRHTIAYVPSSGRVYSFGLGGSGQLGTGTNSNRPSPTTVRGPFVTHSGKNLTVHFSLQNQPLFVVRKLFAGGDQSFATATSPMLDIQPEDLRSESSRPKILTLSEKKIKQFVSAPSGERLPEEMMEELQRLFTSQCCLNGSFTLGDDEHYCCRGKHHGIDMDAARDGFGRLRAMRNNCVSSLMQHAIEDNLIPSLSCSPPHVEALRLCLTLPWCHLFDDPKNCRKVICPFAEKVLSLHATASQVIDMWWASLNSEHLYRLLDIYKQTVVHLLNLDKATTELERNSRQLCLRTSMDFLKKLHSVNEKSGYVIPYDAFYIPELKDKLDIRADYINWIRQSRSELQAIMPYVTQGSLLSFCNYPFVFDAQVKTMLLQTDALLQMQVAVEEVNRRNISSLFLPIDPVNPCLILYVKRNNIVNDTIMQLMKQHAFDFKKPLKVIFLDEEAVDEGGVKKEFFLLLLREILDPMYGMFQYYPDSRLLWFSEETFEARDMFQLIGSLCGLAIYNGLIIDLKFPLALFKKLLNKPVTLDDLMELQPTVAKSLKQLLEYEEDNFEDTFCLTFEISRETYGEVKHIPLKENGGRISVTKENRQEYVNAYLNYVFNSSVTEQFQSFSEGFLKVCGGRVLELFQPLELQAMVVGNEHYDWDQLEKNTTYKGEYYRNHNTIKIFWEVFYEMTQEDKKKFLLFLTGSDRIPIHGMKAVQVFIQPMADIEFLPVAHTCFNLLDLPKYESKDVLQRKLLQAIQQTEGFGLV